MASISRYTVTGRNAVKTKCTPAHARTCARRSAHYMHLQVHVAHCPSELNSPVLACPSLVGTSGLHHATLFLEGPLDLGILFPGNSAQVPAVEFGIEPPIKPQQPAFWALAQAHRDRSACRAALVRGLG